MQLVVVTELYSNSDNSLHPIIRHFLIPTFHRKLIRSVGRIDVGVQPWKLKMDFHGVNALFGNFSQCDATLDEFINYFTELNSAPGISLAIKPNSNFVGIIEFPIVQDSV